MTSLGITVHTGTVEGESPPLLGVSVSSLTLEIWGLNLMLPSHFLVKIQLFCRNVASNKTAYKDLGLLCWRINMLRAEVGWGLIKTQVDQVVFVIRRSWPILQSTSPQLVSDFDIGVFCQRHSPSWGSAQASTHNITDSTCKLILPIRPTPITHLLFSPPITSLLSHHV